MEEENSKKMDVSYGVEKPEDSTQLSKKRKSKKSKKKTVKAEKAPVKKSLIEEIEEMKANNQTKSPEFTKKMAELETILGVDRINPFGTNELDVFEEKLKGMTEADLQDLAYKVGLNPYVPGHQLKGVLKQEFKNQNKNNMRNAMPSTSSVIKLDPNNPDHAETIKILGEI